MIFNKATPLLCTAHCIATSKEVVIFTGRLKGGNEGPFCSRNAFNSAFDNSTRLKRCSP